MRNALHRLMKNRLLAGFTLVVVSGLTIVGLVTVVTAKPTTQEGIYQSWESRQLFAFPGNWDEISPSTVRLIYPGQASWEFLTSPEHPGSFSVLAGTACATCHGNPVAETPSVGGWAGPPADHRESLGCQACHGILEQRVERLGEELVSQGPLETDPIEGKWPYIDVEVEAAYDSEYLYMRYEWTSERPGISHDLLRWDGSEWREWGGPKPDAPKTGITPSYEDRLALNVDDRNLPAFDGAQVGFAQVGCWVTCHASMRAMPKEPSAEEVKADPYLGQVLKKSDVRKYLLNTRAALDETGGWNKFKPEEEIARLFEEGDFLDMLMWRAGRSGPIGYADDFYVLDYRWRDKGKGPFKTQKKPEYMYDEAKVGFRAIPEASLEDMLGDFSLIMDENAVPFDPDASFDVGDIISRRVLRTPTESAADVLSNSRWENGRWVLELRRKLDTGNPDDKSFEPDKVYSIGLAIFDDMVSNRRHHVSFPVTLGMGVQADITAVSLQGTQ